MLKRHYEHGTGGPSIHLATPPICMGELMLRLNQIPRYFLSFSHQSLARLQTTQICNLHSDNIAMNDIIHSVYESPLKKYLVVPCLLFTSVLAALLVVGTHSKWTSGDGFYFLVVQNRASIQIVVQVLSGIFGALHVFTLTTLINFRTRLLLSSQKPVPLSFLSWWNGLCAKRFFDFSLPWLFCFGLLAFGGW